MSEEPTRDHIPTPDYATAPAVPLPRRWGIEQGRAQNAVGQSMVGLLKRKFQEGMTAEEWAAGDAKRDEHDRRMKVKKAP